MTDDNARTAPHLQPAATPSRARGYVSARWRILTPIFAVLMSILMCGAYGLGLAFTQGDDAVARDDLAGAASGAAANALDIGRAQRAEVDRIAFTEGVPQAVVAGDAPLLQDRAEPLAALADLDLVLIAGPDQAEIMGLQRVVASGAVDYAVTTGTDLESIAPVARVLAGADSASALVTVQRRPMLVTAGPVIEAGQVAGVVLVGQDISRVLDTMRGGANLELALFGSAAQPLGDTFAAADAPGIDNARFNAALNDPGQTSFERIAFDEADYQAVYLPFIVGETPLGVLAVYQAHTATFGAQAGQQLLSLVFALVVAGVFIAGYVAVGRQLARVEHIRQTAERLTAGEDVRTGLRAADEIGQMGVALDRYAAAAQLHVRQLQQDVRQQRREIAHLQAILESLPDGVVVQDDMGRVITMNAAARALLGTGGDTPTAQAVRAWSGTLQRRAERVLAPGLVALGDSTEIKLDERVVRVEAAALRSVADKTIGTVLTLQDVTQAIARDAQRDSLIDAIANDVNVSLAQRAQAAALEAGTQSSGSAQTETMHRLAKEIAGDARAMQRMITEYREIAMLRPDELRTRQRAIPVAELLVNLAEAWQPIAAAHGISLHLEAGEADGLHVLGDDKRLLWALGNVLDNAIKYTESPGQVSLAAAPDPANQLLSLTIADTGVGIAADDLPHVQARFYRGTPRRADGSVLEIPGTGQGLYMTQTVIAAHGGGLSIHSRLGEGTRATFVLPLTADVALKIPTPQRSIWDFPTQAEIPQNVRQD